MSKLNTALQQQIDRNKSKNMLYAQLGQIIEIDPDFLAALEALLANRSESFSEPAWQDAIAFASETLIKRLYAINQFIQVSEEKKRELEDIYLRTWQRIVATKNIQGTLKERHYPELTNWIASLYPEDFRKHLRDLPTVGQVVCEEYSPRLQIDLLRLAVQTLKQPLLDIGCGSRAGLVRYFRTLGMEAYGLDRQIGKGATYLQQVDWLEYRFEPNQWGSIFSNMAFTNHLHYVNRHERVQLEPYLQKFKEILESLSHGGSFYYAPGVPFIEERLEPGSYRVERFDVIRDIQSIRITRVAP